MSLLGDMAKALRRLVGPYGSTNDKDLLRRLPPRRERGL